LSVFEKKQPVVSMIARVIVFV